jgi:hypothetical protein
LNKKAKVGGWPNAFVAIATIAEIILVSYLIMLANFLSESDMIEWAGTIIACTGDFMAGAYVDREEHSPLATKTAAIFACPCSACCGFGSLL